jgi:Calx-beta domain
VRERTSSRFGIVLGGLLLGALLLALATADRARSALPGGEPALSVADVLVTEGTGGTTDAVFTVSLAPASTSTVTVDYATSDGAATVPADYASASGTVSFAPGETAKTVRVTVVGDALDEAHEHFALDLSNATAAVADGRGFATVMDDDPLVSVAITDASAAEGGAASFTVSLSTPSGKLVTVDYATADGSAAAPGDYGAASGTLAFWPGDVEETATVTTLQDSLSEGDETFSVTLARVANATLSDAEGLGTVVDDEAPLPPPPPLPPPENAVPDCSNVTPSKLRLRPPNHKFRVVTLFGAGDADGAAPALAVTGVTQDEPVRATRRDKGPDAAWVAGRPDQVKLRAERLGRGNGRVYRVSFTATDAERASCSGTVLVGVRHDARKPWVDSGAVYDSFGG